MLEDGTIPYKAIAENLVEKVGIEAVERDSFLHFLKSVWEIVGDRE